MSDIIDLTPEKFEQELATLRRDYFVALAVLREATTARTKQYERDRAALAEKYKGVLKEEEVQSKTTLTT